MCSIVRWSLCVRPDFGRRSTHQPPFTKQNNAIVFEKCSNVNLLSDKNHVIRFNKTRFLMKYFNSSYKSIRKWASNTIPTTKWKAKQHKTRASEKECWTAIELVLIECNEIEFATQIANISTNVNNMAKCKNKTDCQIENMVHV